MCMSQNSYGVRGLGAVYIVINALVTGLVDLFWAYPPPIVLLLITLLLDAQLHFLPKLALFILLMNVMQYSSHCVYSCVY